MIQTWIPDLPVTQPDAWDTDTWCTPKWLCDLLPDFDLDPCSNSRSHIRAARRFTIEDNGLAQDWGSGLVWCNPPYSDVMPWAVRAADHARRGGCVMFLPKLDPSTKWWSELMTSAHSVSLFAKRIQFEGSPDVSQNNFCSALIVLGRDVRAELSAHALYERKHTYQPQIMGAA